MTPDVEATTLSAAVITLNEVHRLSRCLDSLRFCDEIIVVDAGSTDGTVELAMQFTPLVSVRSWSGYADQRNFAATLCSGQWVLSIDADEVVTEELAIEIRTTLAGPNPKLPCAFSIPRKTIHFNRWIRHGGWYPNRLVRLYQPSSGNWSGNELHEVWSTEEPVGKLQSPILHYSFLDLADQVYRNNKYSTLGAEQLHNDGRQFSLIQLLVRPPWKFIETYVLKNGFRDGLPGLIISISAAYSTFLKWAKLWEMRSRAQEK